MVSRDRGAAVRRARGSRRLLSGQHAMYDPPLGADTCRDDARSVGEPCGPAVGRRACIVLVAPDLLPAFPVDEPRADQPTIVYPTQRAEELEASRCDMRLVGHARIAFPHDAHVAMTAQLPRQFVVGLRGKVRVRRRYDCERMDQYGGPGRLIGG